MSSSASPPELSHFIALPAPIESALEAGGVGIWRGRIGSDELGWTENLEAIHRLPPGSFDGTFNSFSSDIHEDDLPLVMQAVEAAVRDGGSYEIRYRNRPRDGGEAIWIEARGRIVQEADGNRYMTGICQNATERIKAGRQLERRLAQQQAVSALGSYALAEEDLGRILRRAVEVVAATLAVPMAKILEFTARADTLLLVEGVGWQEGLVGQACVGIDQDSQAGYTLLSSDPVIVDDLLTETRFSGPPLLAEHGVRSGLSVVIAGEEGRPFGVFGVHTTELRRFDASDADFLLSVSNIVASSARQARIGERRRIVIREMAHRSGNMFQLVQSLFNQTIGSKGEDQAAQAFRARLDALARTNYLIAQDGWTQARLRTLAETALAGFRDSLDMSGRDILLPASLAFDLALILHELATNSAKYGSLSAKDGRSRLSWQVEPEGETGTLVLEWFDAGAGGREPFEASGSGFGHRLISGLIERKWSGSISVDREQGYRFVARMPIPATAPDAFEE